MNRERALKCLHEELGAWPQPSTLRAEVPEIPGWRWEVRAAKATLERRDAAGFVEIITDTDWAANKHHFNDARRWSEGEERMESVGRNGNDGDHYDDPHEALTFGPTKGRAGGLKFDADKPRMELLIQGMPRALEAVGQVLTFGAQKYEAHSWQLVEDNHNRYWAAKSRHELARAKGEERDPETGLLHLAHEACNALFLLELALMEGD